MTVLDDTGAMIANSEKRYLPFGDVRTDLTITNQSDFGYTGQREIEDSDLMDYNAHFLNPGLARFTQPDTIIPNPDNPQSLNRYSYTLNNPIRYTDPSGHIPCEYDLIECVGAPSTPPSFGYDPTGESGNDGDGDGDPNDELTTGDEPVTPEDWCNNNASKTALQFC